MSSNGLFKLDHMTWAILSLPPKIIVKGVLYTHFRSCNTHFNSCFFINGSVQQCSFKFNCAKGFFFFYMCMHEPTSDYTSIEAEKLQVI